MCRRRYVLELLGCSRSSPEGIMDCFQLYIVYILFITILFTKKKKNKKTLKSICYVSGTVLVAALLRLYLEK